MAVRKDKPNFGDIAILFVLSLFIMWGVDIPKRILTPFDDIKDVIDDKFTLITAGGKKSTFLEDVAGIVIHKSPKSEVYNNEKTEENNAEKTKVSETSISAPNAGKNMNYSNIVINNHTKNKIDFASLMKDYTPIKKKNSPQILIVHTHGTESYVECETSRSEDVNLNVVKVGNILAEKLKDYGFNVLHDPKMHDLPSYNGSYKNTLKTLEWYMENYDGIDMVIDVHRDAIDAKDGSKVSVVSEQKGKKAAQIMFVIGTDECGLSHSNWKENLKLYTGLYVKGNEMYPGLFRPIDLRVERFNQHITKGSVIAEFGCNGNSLEQALYSAELFAEIINEYIK